MRGDRAAFAAIEARVAAEFAARRNTQYGNWEGEYAIACALSLAQTRLDRLTPAGLAETARAAAAAAEPSVSLWDLSPEALRALSAGHQ